MPRNLWLSLTIVGMLGLVALAGTTGIVFTALSGLKQNPPELVAIVSACIGALSSFLVSVPRHDLETQ